MRESAYTSPTKDRLTHGYGDTVHVLTDPWALTLMAHLGHPEVNAPRFHRLLEGAYRHLLSAAAEQLPLDTVNWPTRMTASHPETGYSGVVIRPDSKVVIVDLARAGMVPSYLLQQTLLEILDPSGVRVDHVYMQRLTDEAGRVDRVDIAGSKIGGPVAGATVVVPDPMGATGRSMEDAIELYSGLDGGPPAKIVVCHLVVTPEYLKRITTRFPDVEIYALRVDRGLSAPDVLATVPGARWDEERGLSDIDYIVPGAGGLGELINNAFV